LNASTIEAFLYVWEGNENHAAVQVTRLPSSVYGLGNLVVTGRGRRRELDIEDQAPATGNSQILRLDPSGKLLDTVDFGPHDYRRYASLGIVQFDNDISITVGS